MLGILNQGICKPKINFSLIKVLPLILIEYARNVGNILQRLLLIIFRISVEEQRLRYRF